MSINRAALRREAKRVYKEQIKNVPKKQRLPFSKFFKQYRDSKNGKVNEPIPEIEQDFDFEDMIDVNEISDEDVEDNDASKVIIRDENKEL